MIMFASFRASTSGALRFAASVAVPLALAVASAGCGFGGSRDGGDAAPASAVSVPQRAANENDLTEYQWQVQLATRADGSALAVLQADADRQVRVDFRHRRMAFSGGANTVSVDYRLEGARIVALGDGFEATLIGTSQERAQAIDDALLRYLKPPFRQRLHGRGATQRLHLTGADGTTLVLQTTDAPYGAKGEDVSLEIAAVPRTCSVGCAPLNPPDPNCVSARRLRWVDDRPQPASEWFDLPLHVFDGPRPQPGRRQVLQTRHYPSLSGQACSLGVYRVEEIADAAPLAQVAAQGDTVAAPAQP